MKDIVTLKEFEKWVEYFRRYNLETRIEVESYGNKRIGRLILKRKETYAGKEYEYIVCTTKEYAIATIKDTYRKLH